MAGAQSGLYPSAIALVDGQLYHGDDRAGFDLPSGENPARYKFMVKGRPLYCAEITACEGQIATALITPPQPQVGGEDTTGSGGAGGSQQEKKLRQ